MSTPKKTQETFDEIDTHENLSRATEMMSPSPTSFGNTGSCVDEDKCIAMKNIEKVE
jgi:hypothetical protein